MRRLLFVGLFFLLVFPDVAFSDQLSLSFGPTLDGSIGAQKMATLGYEFQFGVAPSLVLEGGGWNESNGVTGFLGVNLGVHVVSPDGLSARIGVGPTVISQTDDRLSSLFEFHIQARVGIEKASWACGLQFDHLSDAGIVPPNLGRDALSLYLGIPL